MNILDFTRETFANMMSALSADPTSYRETPTGAGYYALRHTVSASGNGYTKLVPRDRSNSLNVRSYIEPQVGMRNPEKRTGRRKEKAQTQIKE